MKKTVSYRDYNFALRQLQESIGGRRISVYEMSDGFGAPIRLGVNWAAIGTVSADEAVEFAAKLTAAAAAAQNFKFNGYVVDWGEN